ncbi:MAG: DUF721 domain-containing protein [Candidatus Fermentibacteraceae bacterium]
MRKVADILHSMDAEMDFSEAYHRSRAIGFWPEAVGLPLSGMCSASGFNEDVILVVASHPAVCMEIRSRSAAIVHRINELAGRALFRRIVVKLSQSPHERLEKV